MACSPADFKSETAKRRSQLDKQGFVTSAALIKAEALAVIDPRKPWENTLVCAQAASWTCADLEFHTVFSQGLAGHDNPN